LISPPKLVLEAVVLVAGLALFRFSHDKRKQRFALIFAACTAAFNLLFDYAAVWPLYQAYGQAAGIGRAGLHALVGFDVVKWGVLAYFLSQMAAGWGDSSAAGGFTALRPNIRLRDVLSTGVLAGIAAAGLATPSASSHSALDLSRRFPGLFSNRIRSISASGSGAACATFSARRSWPGSALKRSCFASCEKSAGDPSWR
jgi:hypothetical protein